MKYLKIKDKKMLEIVDCYFRECWEKKEIAWMYWRKCEKGRLGVLTEVTCLMEELYDKYDAISCAFLLLNSNTLDFEEVVKKALPLLDAEGEKIYRELTYFLSNKEEGIDYEWV